MCALPNPVNIENCFAIIHDYISIGSQKLAINIYDYLVDGDGSESVVVRSSLTQLQDTRHKTQFLIQKENVDLLSVSKK